MLYSHTVGQGQTLVLLHGWGFNAELFNTLIEQYKNQYRITVIDLPGLSALAFAGSASID
jgi:pimeloyl-[acyl-carrier protein] methyl ester esterase